MKSQRQPSSVFIRGDRARGRGWFLLYLKSDELLTSHFLSSLGHTVLSFGSPEDALTAVKTGSTPLHLLITDVIMPGMSGMELAAKVTKMVPGIRCLFCLGLHCRYDHGWGRTV